MGTEPVATRFAFLFFSFSSTIDPMLRAFVQINEGGMPFNLNAYAAYDGFRERGVATDFFRPDDASWWAALPALEDDLVFAAGIGVVLEILDVWGVPRPRSLDYPSSLEPFFGRRVWRTTLAEVRGAERPLFVKSVAAKGVNGHVVRDFADLLRTSGAPDDTPVYVSEPIEFRTEWRVFVVNGEILDVRLYKGSRFMAPEEEPIRAMVRAFVSSSEAPAAFGLDVGWVEGQGMRLVEVNEGFSLGIYGLAPTLAAQMLEARWAEFRAQRSLNPTSV